VTRITQPGLEIRSCCVLIVAGRATALVFDKDNFLIVAEGVEKIVATLDQARKADISVRG
jgi:hypothetical protein